jgi:hypothetical protein
MISAEEWVKKAFPLMLVGTETFNTIESRYQEIQKDAREQLITALQEASRALTELDPLGDKHNATLIDEALKSTSKPKYKFVTHPNARGLVVEVEGVCHVNEVNGGFEVLTPDGSVSPLLIGEVEAQEYCNEYFRKHCPPDKISLGRSEWYFRPKTSSRETILSPKLTIQTTTQPTC